MSIAVYPGTFNPITNGHIDILERASRIFDRVLLSIAVSAGKNPLFSLEERIDLARKCIPSLPNVEVVPLTGLLIDFVRAQGAQVIVRGIRAVSDYEYELQLANMNRAMAPEIETLFLTPADNLSVPDLARKAVAQRVLDHWRHETADVAVKGGDLPHQRR